MNPNQLSRIVLKGFKSIKQCDIQLHELNVLIGPNGAGGNQTLLAFLSLLGAFKQTTEK